MQAFTGLARRLFLLVALCCFALIGGCGKSSGGTGSGTAKAQGVALLGYVDLSGSTVSYPHGGTEGIKKAYAEIGDAYGSMVLGKDNAKRVPVELRWFVRSQTILFQVPSADMWLEEVSEGFENALKKPLPSGDASSKTLFTGLVESIGKRCAAMRDHDVYVMVLTDGHPDDGSEKTRWKVIREAAERFKEEGHTNLKNIFIAPVEPDMEYQWRENLAEALSPLGDGTVTVANTDDWEQAVEAVRAATKEN